MSNASDGARIKVWPGASAALSGDLQGGGGSGEVRNITYDGMVLSNVDYAIEITQCYGQKNETLCNQVFIFTRVIFEPRSDRRFSSRPNSQSRISQSRTSQARPARSTTHSSAIYSAQVRPSARTSLSVTSMSKAPVVPICTTAAVSLASRAK